MKTFKLENGDLVYDIVRGIHMVQGPEELVQAVRMLVSINRGEWFLNARYGLDYSAIQGAKWPANEDRIRDAFMEAFRLESRITDVPLLTLEYDRSVRRLKVLFGVRSREDDAEGVLEVDL